MKMEGNVSTHSAVSVSHGVCPQCLGNVETELRRLRARQEAGKP